MWIEKEKVKTYRSRQNINPIWKRPVPNRICVLRTLYDKISPIINFCYQQITTRHLLKLMSCGFFAKFFAIRDTEQNARQGSGRRPTAKGAKDERISDARI
jgi:hypothetical protein